MTSIQRYNRLQNEHDHYKRRHRMLRSMTVQKRDELENIIQHINQLLLLEKESHLDIFDRGDHSAMSPMLSFEKSLVEESEESDDDPLLQRLKSTRPSRLKASSQVYDVYLSE